MGKIKKIIENELVGGTQSTDVYPVTSVKAVYDENNERLDNILSRRGVVNVSTNYNDDHTAEVLTLEQAIVKVPSSDRTLGFVMTFLSSDGWVMYQYTGDSLAKWDTVNNWESFPYTSRVQSLQHLMNEFHGSLVESNTNLLSTPSSGYVHINGTIVVYPSDTANYYIYPVVPVLEGITYKYSGKISDNVVYAVAFYSSSGELLGGLKKESLINNYTEGTIKAPTGSVFAIVSTKDTYEASLSSSDSYYNNHTINVLTQINKLVNTKVAKVDVEDVKTVAEKNFDGREFKAGEDLIGFLTEHTYIQLSNGAVNYGERSTFYHTSSLIPIKGGEEYNYVGTVSDDVVAGIAFYTGTLQYIKGYGKADNIPNGEVFTITAPDNAVYALVCCSSNSLTNFKFYATNSHYVLSKIKEVQDIQQSIQQDNYPYNDGVKNVIFSLPTSKMSSPNVKVSLVNTGMFIEPNAIKITIGTPSPNSDTWNYYYAKYIGVFPAGEYVAFIKAKRIGTSVCKLQVFSDKGLDYANKTITDTLTEEYQLFAVNCKLTNESNNVNVGISAKYSFDNVKEGDEIYLSLIGFAKNRTEKTIGSDIYTINDILKLGKANANWNISYEASMAIFQGIPSIGMIGDSLMSGATYNHYTNKLSDNEGCEWWRVLERESGAKYLDFASGGLYTKSWLNTFLNAATQEENRCCAYIIGLGVNDAYFFGNDYLGSQSDIDLENSDNNGDTYYGNYAKIIQKLTVFNSRAKFFLLTEPRKVSDEDNKWNGAIRYIANLFDNCYLVDLQDMYNDDYTSGFINDTRGPQAHYPYITYCYMAKLIERAIGKVIMDNAKDFVDIQFAAET